MARKTDIDMFTRIAGSPIELEYISGALYVFGSELATLRIFAKYQTNGKVHNPKARCGYSPNLDRFYFSLDNVTPQEEIFRQMQNDGYMSGEDD